MNHYYPDVPGVGNVALTRHAQDRCKEEGITDEAVAALLDRGRRTDVEGGKVQIDHAGVRAIILRKPKPYSGAALAVTIFRIQRQAKAK